MNATPRRVRIDLSYDGTDFAGWQLQPGRRTVQGVVEEALGRVQGSGSVRVRGAGRTDSGVHARQQVADGRIASRLGDLGLLRALVALLPQDARVSAVRTVPDGFHSRKDAVAKSYLYVLDRSPWGDPFLSRFAHHHPHAIDRDALQDALERLGGRRDFAGFAGSASRVRSTVRTLREARFEERGSRVAVLVFTADGFLNHMVRNLVGTLLDVARGRYAPARIDEVLLTGDRTRAGPTAPAHGLTLARVLYGEEGGDVTLGDDADTVRWQENLL